MEKDVRVESVKAYQTKSGNTRYVLRDDDGNEYTTFKEPIAREAVAAEGKRARIEFHEQQRGEFTNVYLDKVEPFEDEEDVDGGETRSPEEAGWDAAVEAAPYLLGATEAKKPVDPDDLFEKLKPFQERVADDIRDGDDEPSET
jgi:hypothetical protein